MAPTPSLLKSLTRDVPSEDRALIRDLKAYERSRPSMVHESLRAATSPLSAVVPKRVRSSLEDALSGLLNLLEHEPRWKANPEAILKRLDQDSLADLAREAKLSQMEAEIQAISRPTVLKATLQGAGLGLGGLLLAVTDVPLLLISHLRLLTEIGFATGVDLRRPGSQEILVQILGLGYSGDDYESRRRFLAEIEASLREESGPKSSSSEVLSRSILTKAVGNFAEKMAPILLRRRAGTLIPLLGSALGAGANYRLTQDVAEAGRYALLKRRAWVRYR